VAEKTRTLFCKSGFHIPSRWFREKSSAQSQSSQLKDGLGPPAPITPEIFRVVFPPGPVAKKISDHMRFTVTRAVVRGVSIGPGPVPLRQAFKRSQRQLPAFRGGRKNAVRRGRNAPSWRARQAVLNARPRGEKRPAYAKSRSPSWLNDSRMSPSLERTGSSFPWFEQEKILRP